MKTFALIGAAGFVAPRHLKAIQDTGNDLVAAFDKFDSVGVMDSFFPEADFFVEFERFDRHLEKRKREGKKLDYVSVCSPNYLHDAHIRFGLRQGADVICEKPVVLNPWNIDALKEIETESGRRVNTILQLRLHPKIVELRNRILNGPPDKIYDIDLCYITARGHWYYTSWKGDLSKSGGMATNIGVHFFDVLGWIFGPVRQHTVHLHTHDRAAGFLDLEKARVRWFLSIEASTLPEEIKEKNGRSYRSLTIEGEEVDFSEGFTELHTLSYREILEGKGYGLEDARPSIQTVYEIRNAAPVGLKGDYHPFAAKPLTKHPFNL